MPLIFNHHSACQSLFPDWWSSLALLLEEGIVLKEGDQGKKVSELQVLLKEHHCYGGLIDGDFGFRTKNALQLFQGTHDLKSTKVADLQTWKILLGDRITKPKID